MLPSWSWTTASDSRRSFNLCEVYVFLLRGSYGIEGQNEVDTEYRHAQGQLQSERDHSDKVDSNVWPALLNSQTPTLLSFLQPVCTAKKKKSICRARKTRPINVLAKKKTSLVQLQLGRKTYTFLYWFIHILTLNSLHLTPFIFYTKNKARFPSPKIQNLLFFDRFLKNNISFSLSHTYLQQTT